jgi:hypothetical protein
MLENEYRVATLICFYMYCVDKLNNKKPYILFMFIAYIYHLSFALYEDRNYIKIIGSAYIFNIILVLCVLLDIFKLLYNIQWINRLYDKFALLLTLIIFPITLYNYIYADLIMRNTYVFYNMMVFIITNILYGFMLLLDMME